MEQTGKTPLGRLAPSLKDDSLTHFGFTSYPFDKGNGNFFNNSLLLSRNSHNLYLKTITNGGEFGVEDICD